MCIFLFLSADIIFGTLTKKKENTKIEQKVKNKFFSSCSSFVFDQKLFITFFLYMISYKLHSHVHYEEVY